MTKSWYLNTERIFGKKSGHLISKMSKALKHKNNCVPLLYCTVQNCLHFNYRYWWFLVKIYYDIAFYFYGDKWESQ